MINFIQNGFVNEVPIIVLWTFAYAHACYVCSEENVYLLCKKLCSKGITSADGSDLFVAFISNEKKQACMFSFLL